MRQRGFTGRRRRVAFVMVSPSIVSAADQRGVQRILAPVRAARSKSRVHRFAVSLNPFPRFVAS